MKAKTLLIPVAAFAVTVTGAQAFNSEVLQNAGLSDTQIAAFAEAREKREEGDRDGARNVLIEAGIDHDTMEKVREAMHEYKDEHRNAVHKAVEDNDYQAFLEAVAGSPLSDIITSEQDFTQFVEAHQLMKDGDIDLAKEIFDDLGLDKPKGMMAHKERSLQNAPFWGQLTAEQQQAIEVAKKANDKETVRAILEEAGVERPNLGRALEHKDWGKDGG